MTLEEVRALRTLADRMGAVIGVSAILARSRLRELESRADAEAKNTETRRIAETLAHHTMRVSAFVRELERPARVASYGPTARAAVEEVERLAATGRPMTLLTSPGIDAIAWAALAHLASPRQGGLFSVVDATSSSEHNLFRWRDPRESPLYLASGGTLVILDPQALPSAVQTYIGAALADDAGIIVAVPATIDSLVAAGRIEERLADRLGDRAVALPTLSSRGEDLRPLALDHLVRIGSRLRGSPFGLDLRALAVLGEHTWPGNDVELESVLLRAALLTDGDVIGIKELEAMGFRASTMESERPPAFAGAIPIRRRKRMDKRRSGP
jgi:DNA-binding NtrC family response regulator